ncbi:hypothetical protein TSAR_012165 [Trichomalopsis sarcophagae]|uniref:Uncharacterized protein n=1 Tax=Trichomalopsis sarcophagae TaxID=543379 RepID=A0A232FKZ9_9HYME|nr:hypothetical protein TSAR_012165 [Trichomalopsis sarcophagae]
MIVEDIVGDEQVRLTDKSVNKQSILTIVNSENLCLPRSLVTAYTKDTHKCGISICTKCNSRKKFSKKDRLGILLPRGYIMTDNQHRSLWLQFHGCFWHSYPRFYTINRDIDLTSGKSMDARYEKTLSISDRCTTANYQLFKNGYNKRNIKRKLFDLRNAFFGGRTVNTVKVFDCQGQEKIKYVLCIPLLANTASENGEYEVPISTSLGSLTDELSDKGTGTYITVHISIRLYN